MNYESVLMHPNFSEDEFCLSSKINENRDLDKKRDLMTLKKLEKELKTFKKLSNSTMDIIS